MRYESRIMIVRVVFAIAFLIASSSGDNSIDLFCFGCLCDAISRGSCAPRMGCDEHGYCGPFRINWNYWNKAGRITWENDKHSVEAWMKCVTDLRCASLVVQQYMNKYAQDCNGDGRVNCYDFAQYHHLGRCSSFSNPDYQKNFTDCFYSRRREVDFPQLLREKPEVLISDAKKPEELIPISQNCLGCICQATHGRFCPVEENCKHQKCGTFRIDYGYWVKAGKITLNDESPHAQGAFERCAVDTKCASRIVQSYMNKFAWDCDGNGAIDCNDYARIHHLGSCEGEVNITYQKEFEKCAAEVELGLLRFKVPSSDVKLKLSY